MSGLVRSCLRTALAGTWASTTATAPNELRGWVTRGNGSLLLELKTRTSRTEGVDYVNANVVLAVNDVTQSTRDVRFAAEGLYVAATGELRLLAASAPVFASVSASEAEEGGDAYHAALAAAAAEAASQLRALPGSPRSRVSLVSPQFAARDAGGNATASGLRRRCTLSLAATLPPSASADSWHGRPSVRLVATLLSPECGVQLLLNASLLHTDALVSKANNAALLAGAVGMLLLSLTARQMEACSAGAAVNKVSLACICHQSALDSYACLLHLTGGLMVDALFSTFSMTALCYFVLFSFFEMRWMMTIVRVRAPDTPWRQELSALQSKFYAALVAGAMLFWVARESPLTLSLSYGSFWLWQIVHAARLDAVRPLTARYILGVSAARLVMPLYLLACPENWLGVPARPGVAAALVLWVAMQAGVLCGQNAAGARWFIPPCLRPVRYSYHRPATPAERAVASSGDAESGGEAIDCIICMLPLSLDELDARFLTPCGHAFHGPCLLRWMDIKQECPTCRAPLPPP